MEPNMSDAAPAAEPLSREKLHSLSFVACAGAARREKLIGQAAGMVAFAATMLAGNILMTPEGAPLVAYSTDLSSLFTFDGLTSVCAGYGIARAIGKFSQARKETRQAIEDMRAIAGPAEPSRIREIAAGWKEKVSFSLALAAAGKSDDRDDRKAEIEAILSSSSQKIPSVELFSEAVIKASRDLARRAFPHGKSPLDSGKPGPKP